MAGLDDVLLPVFAAQHWLVSMDDILRHGGHAQSATRRVQSGRWEAVDRSVFRLTGAPRPWHAAVLAPILSVGGLWAAAANGTASAARAADSSRARRMGTSYFQVILSKLSDSVSVGMPAAERPGEQAVTTTLPSR